MKFVLPLLLFMLLPVLTFGQKYVEFNVSNLEAGPATGDWMVESNLPYFVDDGVILNGSYAYRFFTWNTIVGNPNPVPCTGSNLLSSSVCTDENVDVLDGVAGVTLTIDNFVMSQFHHINTTNPNLNWNVVGQAGDERVYQNGVGEIWAGGEMKLRAVNCRLTLKVYYPAPMGAGSLGEGSGWGEIDMINSKPEWIAEFDPDGNGQLDFEFSSFSAVLQNCYGSYNTTIRVKPAPHIENLADAILPVEGNGINQTLNLLSDAGVQFNVENGNFGGAYNTENYFGANQVIVPPIGVLPENISSVSPYYWQLGTTLESFTTKVKLDLTGMPGITDLSNLRILKRTNSASTWQTWGDYSVETGADTLLVANGVTTFSEFAIGIYNNPLPVDMVAFNVTKQKGGVLITWKTVTEKNSYGFEIERRFVDSKVNAWETLTFIPGAGNSNSEKNYVYRDINTKIKGIYVYRIKQIDNDGGIKYSGELFAAVDKPYNYSLYQNYPNPFNPTTKIDFQLPVKSFVSLKIYDVLGKEVASLINEDKEEGFYSVDFNGAGLNSGTYFYKLTAGSFSETKKLMILK